MVCADLARFEIVPVPAGLIQLPAQLGYNSPGVPNKFSPDSLGRERWFESVHDQSLKLSPYDRIEMCMLLL